ncbi:hypothetical protein CWE07_00845 [Aliidiomarina maris]|uniref:Uncharacterized protein n=1 Tax=Aliidiomarina maris TaxID=531312 RepID=A0ABY0BW54_9GAMM|nr:hypothetical protein CWE07_00845 [Aliidiomarina maris]
MQAWALNQPSDMFQHHNAPSVKWMVAALHHSEFMVQANNWSATTQQGGQSPPCCPSYLTQQ